MDATIQESSDLPAQLSRLEQEVARLQRQRNALQSSIGRLNQQLAQAGKVQRDLLPGAVDHPAIDVLTLYRPLEQVSGDTFDIHQFGDGQLAIGLADVSGHGIPAAMLTATLRGPFRDHAREDLPSTADPAAVLASVNDQLLSIQLSDGQFVCALHGVYDPARRVLTFARGGLPYPIHIRPHGFARQICSQGTLLGAIDTPRFETVDLKLCKGDVVLFCTDGLEALLLGRTGPDPLDRIEQSDWFAQLPHRPVEQSLEQIAVRLDTINPRHWPADDVTLLALRVR